MCRKVVPSRCLAAVLAVLLALAPVAAQAKAGKSASMGSRGSRTYTAPAPPSGGFTQPNVSGAAPIERSITPTPTVPPTATQPLPPRPATAPQSPVSPPQPSGFFARHPFMGGLLGGLVGAGIGSMLFGGHFFGEGAGGFFGAVLQILLIVMLVRFAITYFRGRGLAGGGMPRPVPVASPYDATIRPMPGRSSVPPAGHAPRPIQFELGQGDLAAFEGLLTGIQTAWTQGDVAQLSRLATPEMVGYFGEQLQEDRGRGVENHVERVQLLKGDVNETWQEGARQYATVTMQWAAVDYTVRRDTGAVVEGDPRNPAESTELWTMVRTQGGPWQLSAIQQLRLLN